MQLLNVDILVRISLNSTVTHKKVVFLITKYLSIRALQTILKFLMCC